MEKTNKSKNESLMWNKFYEIDPRKMEWGYEIPDTTLRKITKVVLNIIKKDQIDVLDVGCGNGRNSKIFDNVSDQKFNYLGIDFSSKAISFCKKEYSGNDNKKFLVKDITKVFKDNNKYFDLIIDFGCFHSIKPEKRGIYIQNISRITKKNGFLIMVVWYKKKKDKDNKEVFYKAYNKLNEWAFNEEDIKTIFDRFFEIKICYLNKNMINDGMLYLILRYNKKNK